MGESSYTFHYLDFEAPSWKSFSTPKLFSSAHVWLLFVFELSDVVQRGFWGRDLSLSRTHAQSLFLHVYWFDKSNIVFFVFFLFQSWLTKITTHSGVLGVWRKCHRGKSIRILNRLGSETFYCDRPAPVTEPLGENQDLSLFKPVCQCYGTT